YIKGATECFPLARIVFDKFHVMVLAGQALDETRRELQRQGVDLKGQAHPTGETVAKMTNGRKSSKSSKIETAVGYDSDRKHLTDDFGQISLPGPVTPLAL